MITISKETIKNRFSNLYIKKKNDNYLGCMRYIDWKRGNPYIFRKDDYDQLINSPFLFARKFDLDEDPEIIERLFNTLVEKEAKI